MTHWNDYASAPDAGTAVAQLDDLKQGATALTVETARGSFPLILVLKDSALSVFVNACPHQYLPLNYRGPNILSANGSQLMCTAHGALFDSRTGAGQSDPVQGCSLDAVQVVIEANGEIRIA